jgi:hypothetical protein
MQRSTEIRAGFSACLAVIVSILFCALPNALGQINEDDLAKNDLKDEDGKEYEFSKQSRRNYEDNHKCEAKIIDRYYLNGEKDIMHDTDNRAKTAKRAASYQGPKCGYVDGDRHKGPKEGACDAPAIGADEKIFGGGIYKKAIPGMDKDIIRNVWRFAEDLLWSKGAQPKFGGFEPRERVTDSFKFDRFVDGNLDIGKRLADNSYFCSENALFLASLLRELGYKVQYKNTVPSSAEKTWEMQTAAVNVWFDGSWKFFDPWKSLDNLDDYKKQRGNVASGGPFHDFITFKRTKPLTRPAVDNPFKHIIDFYGKVKPGTKAEVPNGQEGATLLARPDGWELHRRDTSTDGIALVSTRPAWRTQLRDGANNATGWPGAPSDPYNPDALEPFTNIPLSAYYDPDGLVAVGMGPGDIEPFLPRDGELLFWGFDNTVAETRTYIITVINPTSAPLSYTIAFEVNQVDRTITLSPPGTTLTGDLAPFEAQDIPVQVSISAPRRVPPAPVQDLQVSRSLSTVVLTWSPSTDANTYIVYRCLTTAPPQTRDDLSTCSIAVSGLTQTSFTEPPFIPDDYFYAVTATNAAGESELDPGEDSVEVAAVQRCDINGDGKIDITDITAILMARGREAAPGDPRKADCGDVITVNDARICALRCTNPNCVP